jgi:hypothetical protein
VILPNIELNRFFFLFGLMLGEGDIGACAIFIGLSAVDFVPPVLPLLRLPGVVVQDMVTLAGVSCDSKFLVLRSGADATIEEKSMAGASLNMSGSIRSQHGSSLFKRSISVRPCSRHKVENNQPLL